MHRFRSWLIAGVVGYAALGAVDADAADQKLAAADGTALHAVEYGTGTNGVVLVHDKGRSVDDWSWFAEKLATAGFHVIAVDLRGQGLSKPPDTLTDADYPLMVGDVAAAVTWMHAHGATKVAIVGDKFGANLALGAAANDTTVTNVIALSPGLNISGVTVSTAVEKYGARPLLLVASTDDAYATRTVSVLDEKATGEKYTEILENAGSGVKMLSRSPTLAPMMISWLMGTYLKKDGTAPGGVAGTPVIQGDTSTMKTTGEKYGTPTTPTTPAPEKKPEGPVDLDD